MKRRPELPIRIEPYGRLTVLVWSATRPGIAHLVDFEGFEQESVVCTCEAFIMGHQRPCRHLRAATIPLII